MPYLGDFNPGDVIYFNFTSLDIAATPAVPSNTAGVTVSVYKDDGTSESTDGVTFTGGFDSKAGLNNVKINTAANATFYAAGHDFQAVITAGTCNSVSIANYVLPNFSLQRAAMFGTLNTVSTNVNTINTVVNYPIVATGTMASASANTFGLEVSGSVGTDEFYQGMVVVTDGYAGQQAAIIDHYVGSSHVATIAGTWALTPATNTTFKVYAVPLGKVWQQALTYAAAIANTTGAQLNSISTGTAPTTGAIANAVWEASEASHTNAGTFGRYLDAQVSLAATQASLNTVSNNVNTVSTNVNTVSTTVNTINTTVTAIPGNVWEVDLTLHTNTNTTGEALNNITGGGAAPSASDVANAVWASVIAEIADDTDLRDNIGKMLRGIFQRFFDKVTQTGGPSGIQTMFDDAGTTPVVTMPATDDGTTQTKGTSS